MKLVIINDYRHLALEAAEWSQLLNRSGFVGGSNS